MTAPVIVYQSGIAGNTAVTSGGQSSNRVAGRLALCFCQVGQTGSGTVTFSVSSGWTVGDTVNLGGNLGSVCWAYRVCDGTGSDDVTFTWGGALLSYHAVLAEFTGQASSNFIGQKNSASATSSTTITAAPLNLLHNQSLVYAQLFVMSANQIIGLPTGYTDVESFRDSFGSDRLCYQLPTGSTSDAISESISSNNWASFATEIRSSGLPAARQNNRSHLIG
jgi:hypothetical protein